MLRLRLRTCTLALVALLALAAAPAASTARTIARCGAGFLEEVGGSKVLHLKGTPYEMGYQHGALLRDEIRELVRFLFEVKAKQATIELGGLKLLDPKRAIAGIAATQKKYIPERFLDELRGLADGAGMDLQDITAANFIPEMFHCSGFALSGSATRDGTLYHGRILDYGCDWRLQEHAVVLVAEPEGKIPFVNVTYAGFIGSVTGMNERQVSIGEMGGRGLGHWDGVPMALLVRIALEEAPDLDAAVAVFRDHPRTCEYYYVIADGKTRQAVGMEASWDTFGVVRMGQSHPRLPHAITDAVLLSAGTRYEALVRRVKAGHGTFDADSARGLMDLPVAMKSNLHSVLFEPASTRFWVANASPSGAPAATQPYQAFQLTELLGHQPEDRANALPPPPPPPAGPGGAALAGLARAAAPVQIDLRTKVGVAAVNGEWHYTNVKIVEVPYKAPDGTPNTTYAIEPKAYGPDFDDSQWEVVDPTTLGRRRSTGLVCFCWYRIKLTIPEQARGKRVFFQTTVDDYGEVWIDGKLPRKVGQSGGAVVAGFNVPNRLELSNPEPGKSFQIAIFGMNGPISAMPTNYIFLGPTFLELVDPQ